MVGEIRYLFFEVKMYQISSNLANNYSNVLFYFILS